MRGLYGSVVSQVHCHRAGCWLDVLEVRFEGEVVSRESCVGDGFVGGCRVGLVAESDELCGGEGPSAVICVANCMLLLESVFCFSSHGPLLLGCPLLQF